MNIGQGCYDGRIYIDELKEIVLVAVKTEAQKMLNKKSRRSQKQAASVKENVLAELQRQASRITQLDRRIMVLYEEFAKGKIDKVVYLASKAELNAESENAQACVAELNRQLADTANITTKDSVDEPLLQRLLNVADLTGEVVSLIDRITVYDVEHIEIRFAFGDANAVKD